MTNKEWIDKVIEEKRGRIIDVSDQIFAFAETGFHEFRTARLYEQVLKQEGFHVETGIAQMPTAFLASYGTGKPVIGFLAEYDALPELSQAGGCTTRTPAAGGGPDGHGCGHNLLGAGAMAATLAVKAYLEEHPGKGTVILYGCPSEEKGNGKVFLARSHAFDCLDAAELMSVGVNYLREHIIPEARIHYAYRDVGGIAPNVVQGHSCVHYFIRAPKSRQVQEIYKRVIDVAEGAAKMTGTEMSYELYSGLSDYLPNRVLTTTLHTCMETIGAPDFNEEDFALAEAFLHQTSTPEELEAKKAFFRKKYGAGMLSEILKKPLDTTIAPLEWKETTGGVYECPIPDENLVPQPCLAESYEIVSDTEWLFHLRKGVLFHNGQEMTAKDVKASLELCKESPQVAQYGKSTGTIEIVDDYTIKIITDGPQSGLLSDLCNHGNMILPADLIESGHDFNKEPIGTGPYKLTAWNKGEGIELEAFDDYWDGTPSIKHVTWKVIPEGSSRTMALEAGTGHNWMMTNTERAPFNNTEFRLAVDSAIDKAAVIQVSLNGAASISNSLIAECFAGVVSDGAPTYDVEKAKEYFAASGLDPADCGFSLICSDDTKLRQGQIIQSCLKDVLGVDITLESMDLATYLDATASGDYDAAIGGYTTDCVLSYAMGVYHSSSIGASNKTRINDPEIDALIETIKSTLDP